MRLAEMIATFVVTRLDYSQMSFGSSGMRLTGELTDAQKINMAGYAVSSHSRLSRSSNEKQVQVMATIPLRKVSYDQILLSDSILRV